MDKQLILPGTIRTTFTNITGLFNRFLVLFLFCFFYSLILQFAL